MIFSLEVAEGAVDSSELAHEGIIVSGFCADAMFVSALSCHKCCHLDSAK